MLKPESPDPVVRDEARDSESILLLNQYGILSFPTCRAKTTNRLKATKVNGKTKNNKVCYFHYNEVHLVLALEESACRL